MPKLDRTFTSNDVLRVWARYLDGDERFEVALFFFNEFAVKPSEIPIGVRESEATFNNVLSIVGQLAGLIPGGGRALESVIILLGGARTAILELTRDILDKQDSLFDFVNDPRFE